MKAICNNASAGKLSLIKILLAGVCFLYAMSFGVVAQADERILDGITIGDISIGGMTKEEAVEAADDYVSNFTSSMLELDVDGNKVDITAGELGYYWKNTEVIDKALEHCRNGNVIARYKESKDIQKQGIKYEFVMDVNDDVMAEGINDKCGKYNVPHVNASLTKTGSGFSVSKESSGRMIDMETSIKEIHNFLLNEWNGEKADIILTIIDDEPTATAKDCERVKDLLGSYSTTFSTSSGNYDRNKNIENGIRLLNGITLCQGETFSVNSFLEPWTEENGWHPGGTYVNGKVEDSLGGGICQVSTTLYNAVLRAELEIVQRSNHSMSVGYVPLSMDAALAGTWKDLKFRNDTDTPIYVEGIYTAGKITFNIYGEETRPSNRTIEFVSETLSTIAPSEVITEDDSKPESYRVVTENGHTGYKARLWKKIYIDGSLESEEIVNTSTYSASPTYITVGKAKAPEETSESTDVPAAAEPSTEPDTRNTEKPAETHAQTQPEEKTTEPTTKPQEETPAKETEAAQPTDKPEEPAEPSGE